MRPRTGRGKVLIPRASSCCQTPSRIACLRRAALPSGNNGRADTYGFATNLLPDLAAACFWDEEPADDCRDDRDDDGVPEPSIDVAVRIVRRIEVAQVKHSEKRLIARPGHRRSDDPGVDKGQPATELAVAQVIRNGQ